MAEEKPRRIPIDLIESMNKTTHVDTTDSSSLLEAVMRERGKTPSPQSVPAAPSTPTVPMISIDGYILPADAVTLMMYVLVTVLSKDKRVKKILNDFKFEFADLNKKPIYPKGITKGKVSRKR